MVGSRFDQNCQRWVGFCRALRRDNTLDLIGQAHPGPGHTLPTPGDGPSNFIDRSERPCRGIAGTGSETARTAGRTRLCNARWKSALRSVARVRCRRRVLFCFAARGSGPLLRVISVPRVAVLFGRIEQCARAVVTSLRFASLGLLRLAYEPF